MYVCMDVCRWQHLNCLYTGDMLKSESGLWPVGTHAVIQHGQPRHRRQPDAQTEHLTAAFSFASVDFDRRGWCGGIGARLRHGRDERWSCGDVR